MKDYPWQLWLRAIYSNLKIYGIVIEGKIKVLHLSDYSMAIKAQLRWVRRDLKNAVNSTEKEQDSSCAEKLQAKVSKLQNREEAIQEEL